jgi:hypothetical protein
VKWLDRWRANRAFKTLPLEDRLAIEGGFTDEEAIDRLVFQMTYLGPFPCPLDGRGHWVPA